MTVSSEYVLRPGEVVDLAHAVISNATRPSSDGEFVAISDGIRFESGVLGSGHVAIAELYGIPQYRDRALSSLFYLFDRQGKTQNDVTEEEPGRILHEERTLEMCGHLPARQAAAARSYYHSLGAYWYNGDGSHRWRPEDGILYFGSDENTLRTGKVAAAVLVSAYKEIQARNLTGRGEYLAALGPFSDRLEAIRKGFEAVVSWDRWRTSQSGIGLIVDKPMNPRALWPHSQWNSTGNLLHKDGSPMNVNGGHASLIVQGLSYDLSMSAAEVERAAGRSGAELRAARFEKEAADKGSRVDEYFITSLDDGTPYAVPALGQDEHGAFVPQNLVTSDALETLSTGLWNRPGAEGIIPYVARLCLSIDFMTSGGIRLHANSTGRGGQEYIYTHGRHAVSLERNLRGVLGFCKQGYPGNALETFARTCCLAETVSAVPNSVYFSTKGSRLSAAKADKTRIAVHSGEEYPRSHYVPAAAMIIRCSAQFEAQRTSGESLLRVSDHEEPLLEQMPRPAPAPGTRRQFNPYAPRTAVDRQFPARPRRLAMEDPMPYLQELDRGAVPYRMQLPPLSMVNTHFQLTSVSG